MLPWQMGPLLDADGAAGIEFTIAFTELVRLVHPFTVAVTEYMPPLFVLTLLMITFCWFEVNPLGPVQL